VTQEGVRGHLLSLYEGLLGRAIAVREEHQDQPAIGSIAHQELTALEPQLVGSWHSSPVLTALAVGSSALASGLDHLHALRVTLQSEGVVVAHVTLARAALEAFGRAWWVFDPSLDGRQRVARGLTELLYGMRQNLGLGPPLVDRERTTTRMDEIVSGAVARSLTLLPQKGDSRAPEIGERRPEATELIRQLLEGSDSQVGAQLFRVYSAMSHSTMPGLATLIQADFRGERKAIGRLTLDPVLRYALLGFSILGLDAALSRQAEVYGWTGSLSFKAYRATLHPFLRRLHRALEGPNDST
jgi:hypothetical protein